tara:strand:+ start:47132 stop:48328 length:1197 start_codon:yes stop_codon:yes gene_type:complete
MLNFETYAPINVPLNWQSELITDNEQRYSLLQKYLSSISGLKIQANDWPMGYGSLEYDNLPVLYQAAAIIEIQGLITEQDVSHAKLYVYDNCLAVLNLGLIVDADITNIDDLAISKRVEDLSKQYLAPLLKQLYLLKTEFPLMTPRDYKFFYNDKDELTNAKPLWVARMLTQEKGLSSEHYIDWLKNVDSKTDFLQLGSGNSLLTEAQYFSDVHRVMIMSQFHSALMNRIESLLKENLKTFNSNYRNKKKSSSLSTSVTEQQYRNDHIEYINIQVSAASNGVQGKRRELLQQFNLSWGFSEQRERVSQLIQLTQARIDRSLQDKLRQQNRGIQTLLAFLGSLGLISLVVDLISIKNEVTNEDTIGLFDLINIMSAENFLSVTFIIVILFTLYVYKNHE